MCQEELKLKSLKELDDMCNRSMKEVESLDDSMRDLKYKIAHDQKFIDNAAAEIEELAKKIESIKNELPKKEKSLAQNRNALKEIESSKIELLNYREKVKEVITEKAISKFNEYIINLGKKKFLYAKIDKTTKTIPLLDEFTDSSKEFLILDTHNYLSKNGKFFSFIIAKSNYNVPLFCHEEPTMTELKQRSGRTINYIDGYPERMKPLAEYIAEIDAKQKLQYRQIVPFQKFFKIGGQTSDNRTGYGWEWDWSGGYGDYFEGTLYGETTTFYIVGIKVKDFDY